MLVMASHIIIGTSLTRVLFCSLNNVITLYLFASSLNTTFSFFNSFIYCFFTFLFSDNILHIKKNRKNKQNYSKKKRIINKCSNQRNQKFSNIEKNIEKKHKELASKFKILESTDDYEDPGRQQVFIIVNNSKLNLPYAKIASFLLLPFLVKFGSSNN